MLVFVTNREDILKFLTKSGQNDVGIRDQKTCLLFLMWRNANLSLNVTFVRNDPHATRSTAGWRWIIVPCGMPACVTPRGTSDSPKGSLLCIRIFVTISSVLELLFARTLLAKTLNYVDTGRPSGTCGRGLSSIRALARVAGSQSCFFCWEWTRRFPGFL